MSSFDPHSPFNNTYSGSPCAPGAYKPLAPRAFRDAGTQETGKPEIEASKAGLFSRLKSAAVRALSALGR
jgi:hypothetical protein